jgi:hypothetical protein
VQGVVALVELLFWILTITLAQLQLNQTVGEAMIAINRQEVAIGFSGAPTEVLAVVALGGLSGPVRLVAQQPIYLAV